MEASRNIKQYLWHVAYEETFALVAIYTSIKSVLALDAVMKWKIHQMDVKTNFFNGVLEEEVYVE